MKRSVHSKLDKLGTWASLICLIHCAFLPIILGTLPLLGLAFLADERIEMVFISISALLAASSLCWGVKKHKRFFVPAIGATGFALLAVGHMFEGMIIGTAGLTLGGLSVCLSHIINYKLCDGCNTCQHHH